MSEGEQAAVGALNGIAERSTWYGQSGSGAMPENPAEISIETTGWLITFIVAIVFVAIVVIVS